MEAQGRNARRPRPPRQEARSGLQAGDVEVGCPAGALPRFHREAPPPELFEEVVQHEPHHVGITSHQEE
eukprot:4269279-Prorocentrum_lima.AAC.1